MDTDQIKGENNSPDYMQFDIILRSDDSLTGKSQFKLQRFDDRDDDNVAISWRNTTSLTEVDVIKLETELWKGTDAGTWKQVDINGDGILGLNLNGKILAQTGADKIIDGRSGLLIVDGVTTKDKTVLDQNTHLLTTNDGNEVYKLNGYTATDLQVFDNKTAQVIFTNQAGNHLSQIFDASGHAVGGVAAITDSEAYRTIHEHGISTTEQLIHSEMEAAGTLPATFIDTTAKN
jgi:hypothetical protein